MLKIPQLEKDSDSVSLVQHINHQTKMQTYVPQSNRDMVGKTHSDKPTNMSNTMAYHFPHVIPIL